MLHRNRELSAVRILRHVRLPKRRCVDERSIYHERREHLQHAPQDWVLLQRVVRVGEDPVRVVCDAVVSRVEATHAQCVEDATIPHGAHSDDQEEQEKQLENNIGVPNSQCVLVD